jgi:hypothetical protein
VEGQGKPENEKQRNLTVLFVIKVITVAFHSAPTGSAPMDPSAPKNHIVNDNK